MGEQEVTFLPYDKAKEIVANVIEEEHIHEPGRRILTVYDHEERELCWFDAEEVLAELDPNLKGDDLKIAAVEYILRRIPDWVVQD